MKNTYELQWDFEHRKNQQNLPTKSLQCSKYYLVILGDEILFNPDEDFEAGRGDNRSTYKQK